MTSAVHIHYLRPPGHEEVFTQHLLHDAPDLKVTLATDLDLQEPMTIRGKRVLESGSSVVWFTFPGEWHDIGRFHTRGGTLTGLYANILTPATFHDGGLWRTTDLFLDVWLAADPEGEGFDGAELLDVDEFEEACRRGWIDETTRARARHEADTILRRVHEGRWPPAEVADWTLERSLRELVALQEVGGAESVEVHVEPREE